MATPIILGSKKSKPASKPVGIIQKVANIALKPSVAIGNLVTKGIEKVTNKTYGRTTSEELSKTTAGKVLGTAIAGTAVALGAAVAAPKIVAAGGAKVVAGTAAKSAAKVAIAHPVKTAALGLGAATVLQSETLTKAATKLPSEAAKLTTNVAQLADEPSLEKLKDIVKDSPVLTAALGGLAAVTVGKGLLGTAATYMNTKATKENTELMAASVGSSAVPVETAQGGIVAEKATGNASSAPIPQEYTTISSGTRKYYKRKSQQNRISQNVRVIVQNKNTGVSIKKYLKGAVLA